MLFQRYLFKALQLQGKVTRRADDFVFRADCFDEHTAWDSHVTKLAFFNSILSYMQQTARNSLQRSVAWNIGNLEVPKSFVGYSKCLATKPRAP